MMGLDAKLYYGTAGSTAATELTITREVDIQVAGDEINQSTRATGWKQYAAGQKDLTISLTVLNDISDAGYIALRNAWLNRTNLAIYAKDKATGEGPDLDCCVTSLGRPEPLEGEIVVTFTLKPARTNRAPTWA